MLKISFERRDGEASVIKETSSLHEEVCGTWRAEPTFKEAFPDAAPIKPSEHTWLERKDGKKVKGIVCEPDMACRIGCVDLKKLIGI